MWIYFHIPCSSLDEPPYFLNPVLPTCVSLSVTNVTSVTSVLQCERAQTTYDNYHLQTLEING